MNRAAEAHRLVDTGHKVGSAVLTMGIDSVVDAQAGMSGVARSL
jgi:hypothetical protein